MKTRIRKHLATDFVIYKTTNLINGKIYIGQDKYNRGWYLGSGSIFSKALKKHGRKNFLKEVIEHISSLDEANQREIYWIAFYNSTKKEIGYNITTGGSGVPSVWLGRNHKEDSKLKMAEYRRGKPTTKGRIRPEHERVHLSKVKTGVRLKYAGKIVQINPLDNSIIKIFNSANDVKDAYGNCDLGKAVKGRFAAGFLWRWLKDLSEEEIINGRLNIPIVDRIVTKVKNRVYQLDKENNLIKIWQNPKEINIFYNTSMAYHWIKKNMFKENSYWVYEPKK